MKMTWFEKIFITVCILIFFFCSTVMAEWKMNPHTGKLDYYLTTNYTEVNSTMNISFARLDATNQPFTGALTVNSASPIVSTYKSSQDWQGYIDVRDSTNTKSAGLGLVYGAGGVSAGITAGSVASIGLYGSKTVFAGGDDDSLLAQNTAVPDCTWNKNFVKTQNTAPTSITNFTGARGQFLTIHVNDNNTTFVQGANIKLEGGVSYTAVSGDMLTFVDLGDVWYEISRVSQSGVNQAVLKTSGAAYGDTKFDFFNLFTSAGRISGGDITTNATAGNVDIASGEGVFRTADDDTSPMYFGNWSASYNQTIPSNTTRFIGVEWNNGNPQIDIHTSFDWNLDTDFPLGRVINDNSTLHVMNNPWWISDGLTNVIERFDAVGYVTRDVNIGGLILGETGTRNLTLTAGKLWSRFNEYTITAINTAVSGTFEMYWRKSGGGFNESTGNTAWDNLQYDDGDGTLGSLGVAKYGNLFFFVDTEGDLVGVYGTAQYNTAADAQAAGIPSSLPDVVVYHSIYVGRLTFLRGASTATSISNPFITLETSTTASTHNNLSGLQGGTAGNRYHSDQAIDTTSDVTFNKIAITNTTQGIRIGTSATAGQVLTADVDGYGTYQPAVAAASGSSDNVQFNDGGSLAGSSNMTWTNATNVFSVTGNIACNNGTVIISDGTAPTVPIANSVQLYANTVIDGYTVSLLHLEGSDTSTTFTDSAKFYNTWTATANAQIDTGQKKFGSSSLLCDGTGDYISTADSDDWFFGYGDFTIDFWTRFNSVADCVFFSQYQGSTEEYHADYSVSTDRLTFFSRNAAGILTQFYISFNPSADTWYHIAFVRDDETWYAFIDGISASKTLVAGSYSSTMPQNTGTFRVGARGSDLTINGWIDEFRISKGVARWTADFTPDTAAYPTTAELCVLDGAGNSPVLSPHHPVGFEFTDPNAWAYTSTNRYTGETISVDMYNAIKDLEEVTKKKYIYVEEGLPNIELTDEEIKQLPKYIQQKAGEKQTTIRENKNKTPEVVITNTTL